MKEPSFLTPDQVCELHREAIERFGGTLGIRDAGGLNSAIFHPQNVFFYGRGDLFEIAAAYAFHIAEAQAFLDGNKRAAIAAALTFLEGNGVATEVESAPLYEAMMMIANRQMSRLELADLFRRLFNA